MNGSEKIAYPNIGGQMNILLRGKLIALISYIKDWRDLILVTTSMRPPELKEEITQKIIKQQKLSNSSLKLIK